MRAHDRSSPRFCRRSNAEAYRDACSNSPQPARTIGRVFDTAEGTRRAFGRTAKPADPVPPARATQPNGQGASGRQLALDCIWQVAARGRAARPTKAGGKSEEFRELAVSTRVQTGSYTCLYLYRSDRGLSDGCVVSIARRFAAFDCRIPFLKSAFSYFYMGLIRCVSLMEYRVFSLGPERNFLLGLERAFSLGLNRAD